jgi:hypothetical protein
VRSWKSGAFVEAPGVLLLEEGDTEKRGQIERLEREPRKAFGGDFAQSRSAADKLPSRYACGALRRENPPRLRGLYFVTGARGSASSIVLNCLLISWVSYC